MEDLLEGQTTVSLRMWRGNGDTGKGCSSRRSQDAAVTTEYPSTVPEGGRVEQGAEGAFDAMAEEGREEGRWWTVTSLPCGKTGAGDTAALHWAFCPKLAAMVSMQS
mmetsp:Transcript_83622/g.270273  ORF Transcript_83622/g.270273 Transcript_83622/m.270273 type:complete len:107 (+) Transcript_83622:339-659(+)